MATVRDDQLQELVETRGAAELFEAIVTSGTPASQIFQASDRALRPPPRRFNPVWKAAAVFAVVIAVSATALAIKPKQAAAVMFRSDPSWIIAIVTDPAATASRLHAEFARQKLNISLHLLPVSPSIVGTVVYVGADDPQAVQPLQGGTCPNPGGACPIGLRIARGYTGRADVALGRQARPDEAYLSAGDAFSPGEVLHCTGLLGATVGDALPVLHRLGLTVEWRDEPMDLPSDQPPTTGGPPAPSAHIWSATPFSPGRVILWTAKGPLKNGTPYANLPSHLAAINRGC
jgi:hypothetical protein